MLRARRPTAAGWLFSLFSLFSLSLVSLVSASLKRGLFLLGDSTSRHLYRDALMPLCQGEPDPAARVRWELNGCTLYKDGTEEPLPAETQRLSCKYEDTPLRCHEHSPFSRVGYTLHWGVQPPAYFYGWTEHRTLAADTANSTANILSAFTEFQSRAPEGALFVFLSCQWTVRRYHSYFVHEWSPLHYGRDYRAALRSLLHELRARLRPADTLALSTCHRPDGAYAMLSDCLNAEIRTLHMRNVHLFDEAELLDRVGDPRDVEAGLLWPNVRVYLKDEIHQTPAASARIGLALLEFMFANASQLDKQRTEQRQRWGGKPEGVVEDEEV